MAADNFDVEHFERRLQSLKDSQESIQSLSAWCLERRQHHKKIVATWLQVLKKVRVEHRLTLFYLANDVIQYSKRKNFEFVESWGTTLQRATTMVRDEKVKHRILRIFKIWDQRQVYDEEFLADLSGLISAAPKKKPDPQPTMVPDEFQSALLISTMRSCATLEQATDARLRDLRESNIDIENAEELCASLKDRRRVEDAEKEVETAVRNVENYVRALEAEIRERTQVLELLEQADQFYETQRGEVKVVTNAYRNFGSRVKNLKKKLDELLPTFVSPIPSPDINAPSPSPDSDIELPGDEIQVGNPPPIIDVAPPSIYGTYTHDYDPLPVASGEMAPSNDSGDFTNNFYSFIGGNMDFCSMKNLFNERSDALGGINQQYNDSLEAKPIEVISSRASKNDGNNEDFNISSFLKTVLPSSDGAPDPGGIPGLGLDESQIDGVHSNYTHSPTTPLNSRLISNQTTILGNNCQMVHSTPLPGRNLSAESHTPSPYSSQNSQSNITLPFENPGNTSAVNPLPPPPLPPPIFLDDENCYNKLPPKFPTWTPTNETVKEPAKWEEKGKNSMNPSWAEENDDERWDSNNDNTWPNPLRSKSDILSETPESPPMYEKSAFREPVQYDEPQPPEPLLSSAADVDHRIIPMPMAGENQLPYRLMKNADVDHRNLISLTGSPANHNNSDSTLGGISNNNSLWSTEDQDYRQHVQPGDIVESVDMEMSDEESDNKQKGRVLVDVRTQDRDMRVPLSSQGAQSKHMDMDMRMIPLPSGQMPSAPRNQMMSDVRPMHPGPPLPPPSQFHQSQSGFHSSQEFRRNPPIDFHSNPNFHQNPPPNFLPNQSDFRSGQQEFPHHQNQQDFDFHENRQSLGMNQDFMGDSPLRGRYLSSLDHQHRDSPNFHRNDRNNRGGRGFNRGRRDRYSEDHNHQRNNANRKSRGSDQPRRLSPENVSRTQSLKPPDTVMILDDDGMPISMPDLPNMDDLGEASEGAEQDAVPQKEVASDKSNYGEPDGPDRLASTESDNQQEAPPSDMDPNQQQYDSTESSKGPTEEIPENQPPEGFQENTRQLSEQLETAGNPRSPSNELKRANANGSFDDTEDESLLHKRILLPNGPETSESNPNGPVPHAIQSEHFPGVVYDYENHGGNFRPRLPGSTLFPPWRPGLPRGSRGGFRGGPGGPRAPWGPRAPPAASFVPRGGKRGGQFRGAGFRGRGRGTNW
ncbi:uncharacterized protein [Prorops nasuta]|uniref:uncharacterized protein isoform X2 n=1 Tax=Prorops nasuta TaxID=863751 RepID=UPI0034CF160C